MTLREFFLQRHKAEFPVTLRVLRALPADGFAYKPHDRSPSAEQVVRTLTGEFEVCVDVVTDHRGEWKEVSAPPAEMIARFERAANDLAARVEQMTEEDWSRSIPFYYGGKLVSEQPAGQFLWFILFDAIHHRGQLSAYLRPMGGKVPAIYGPSADERSK